MLHTSVPHRANGVDDDFGGKAPGGGHLRISRRAAAQKAAFGEYTWPSCLMNCPVDTTATQEGRVGGVDYRIRFFICRDVAQMHGDRRHDESLPRVSDERHLGRVKTCR